ncbi:MAG: acyl-CoA thioesterase [Planctomycetia bacterium]|nr:acyl-CoA thioesterase [Planctomycetia bacterium]
MPDVFELSLTVREDQIDALGHVGNLVYLQWAVDAAVAHSAAQGWDETAYFHLGAGFVVRSHQIEYLRPARLADAIVVRTWVATFRPASSLRRYKIVRRADGLLLAQAATDWAFVKLATLTPTRIPPEVRDAFVLVPDE